MVYTIFKFKSDNQGKNNFYYFVNHGDFRIVKTNLVAYVLLHLIFLCSIYVVFAHQPLYTVLWTNILSVISMWGGTVGAHRLWAHKSFKATLPLQVLLMVAQTISTNLYILFWVKTHRAHHKWTDTDGDPHTTTRGFLFAHVGWVLHKKHPEVRMREKSLDFSDLEKDTVITFQRRHHGKLHFVFAFLLPVAIPVLLWGESPLDSFLIAYVGRIVHGIHAMSLINSAGHMFGARPYNANIRSTENSWVTYITHGEGYHNYHHEFPRDYKASELGHAMNSSQYLIEFMAKVGHAHDLKTPSKVSVESAKERTRLQMAKQSGHEHFECPDNEYETEHKL